MEAHAGLSSAREAVILCRRVGLEPFGQLLPNSGVQGQLRCENVPLTLVEQLAQLSPSAQPGSLGAEGGYLCKMGKWKCSVSENASVGSVFL